MGCWDVFCFLCGNPPHKSFYNSSQLADDIKYYESKEKKSKWFINYFKPIYQAYLSNPKFMDEIKIGNKTQSIGKLTKWMDSCTFLTVDNRVIHKCSEVSCNVTFVDSKRNAYTHDPEKIFRDYSDHGLNYGVFVHTDCYKWIKSTYKFDLKFSHLPITYSSKVFGKVKYGSIEKYWLQDFDFVSAIVNSDADLLASPLATGSTTGKRIGKIFTQLKIRLDANRVGPVVSASFYPSGIYRVGTNGNIWTTSGGKWKEIKEPVVKVTYTIGKIKLSKLTKDFVASSEPGSIPVFVVSIKTKKNTVELVLLTTQSQIEKLNKKLV